MKKGPKANPPSSSGPGLPLMGLLAILLSGLLLVLTIAIVHSDESEDAKYLYAALDPEDYFPVHELLVNETSSLSENELPKFLSSTDSGHRIVEFYAPWCPHCRHFKDHFIQFARNLETLAVRAQVTVDVHAVSCTAHREICNAQDVHSYPTIKIFPAGSINGTIVKVSQVHPFHVLDKLGIKLDMLTPKEKREFSKTSTKKKPGSYSKTKVALARSKEQVYADATRSFDFALRQSVFMAKGPLEEKRKDIFLLWLDLLHNALPPSGTIQHQIDAILENEKEAMKSEENLLALVDPFRPENKEWSQACTHGEKGMGYTCGLWELFHIMTIGLVEFNKMAPGFSIVPTMTAADALRDYIENFFGCEVCRVNFLAAYDDCSLDRCNRLSTEKGKLSDWKQLALWLWETHNAVNIRLMKEKAKREGRETSHQDEINVRWPSKRDCSVCWRDDESWDEENIFQYLRLEYWPDNEKSAFIRNKLSPPDIAEDDSAVFPAGLLVFCLLSVAGLVYVFYKKNQLARSGRHKKSDEVCDYVRARRAEV